MRQAENRHRRGGIAAALLVALALALVPGCGLKGAPEPPETAVDPYPFP